VVKRRVLRSTSYLILAVSAAAALAACSSPAPTLASSTAACLKQAAPRPPKASANPGPGDLRWTAVAGRCVSQGQLQYPDEGPGATVWATAAPGGGLAVFVNGVVSLYSATGTVLWQRTVAPPSQDTRLENLYVSPSIVLVEFTEPGSAIPVKTSSTFLNAANGQPLGKTGVTLASTPFLVGDHVVLDSATGDALEGYDPATGQTLWTTPVPAAPDAAAETDDGSVVYLDSAGGDSPAPMRRIDRLDAATGRLLPAITLPKALAFNLTAEGGNQFDQGLLLLSVAPPCGTPGCAATQTVAVDTANGTVRWSRSGDVVGATAGLFSQANGASQSEGASSMTAVNPATGKDAWTWQAPQPHAIGTNGGPNALLLRPDYVAAWTSEAKNFKPAVVGYDPGTGKQVWTSPTLSDTLNTTAGTDTVYAFDCVPWSQSSFNLCSSIDLLAIDA
jgi:outer membrane protein assembly factor BamB